MPGDLPSEQAYPDALVRSACGGDQQAFGVLFHMLYPRVHRTVWAMLGDESEAHDVAQAAWIKAWQNRHRFNFQSLYTTWIHRIAVNCALDALRRRRSLRRRFTTLLDRGGRFAAGSVPDPADPATPQLSLSGRELGQAIEAAIAALPEEQRVVLVLREYEGYSYAEIAQILSIQPGTVMSRLHNARKKLQSRLAKELP